MNGRSGVSYSLHTVCSFVIHLAGHRPDPSSFQPTRRGRPCFITASSPSLSPPHALSFLFPSLFLRQASRRAQFETFESARSTPIQVRLNVGRSVGFSAFLFFFFFFFLHRSDCRGSRCTGGNNRRPSGRKSAKTRF